MPEKPPSPYTVFFAAVLSVIVYRFGVSAAYAEEYINMLVLCMAADRLRSADFCCLILSCRDLMGVPGRWLWAARWPGAAVMSKLSLIAPIIGIMYVVSCVSDIIQVAHYKRTKRRVFLMAPFHHHLERKGMHENKIVSLYTLVTFFVGAVTLIIILALN